MTEACTREISKADLVRQAHHELPGLRPFSLQMRRRRARAELSALGASASAPVNVLMIVCQNCGAIQFHDRAVVAQWLDCQHKVLVP
jgi:hypothetical protein